MTDYAKGKTPNLLLIEIQTEGKQATVSRKVKTSEGVFKYFDPQECDQMLTFSETLIFAAVQCLDPKKSELNVYLPDSNISKVLELTELLD